MNNPVKAGRDLLFWGTHIPKDPSSIFLLSPDQLFHEFHDIPLIPGSSILMLSKKLWTT